jgi:hypothetical protein
MPNDDIFENFSWHSSIGIDFTLDGDRRFVSKIPNSKKARSMFADGGNGLLIHKTSRCLWRISDDKKCIEPVFGTDVLTDEDVAEAMKESS